MSSILVGELNSILNTFPDDYEVIMNIKHKYPISKKVSKFRFHWIERENIKNKEVRKIEETDS